MQGLGFCPGVGEGQVLAATMESVSHEKEEVVWARAALSGCSGAPGSLPRCRLWGPLASGRRVQGRLCVPGPVLFWVIMTLVVVVGSSSFLLCHRRACRKWIRQSEWM